MTPQRKKTIAERVKEVRDILIQPGERRGLQVWFLDRVEENAGWRPGEATVSRYFRCPSALRTDTKHLLDSVLRILEAMAKNELRRRLSKIGP